MYCDRSKVKSSIFSVITYDPVENGCMSKHILVPNTDTLVSLNLDSENLVT